jgi:hypothetical protein
MIRVKRRYLVIYLAVLVLALAVGTAYAATQQPSRTVPMSSSLPTPIVIHSTATPPGVGATQTTAEGLAITLVQIVKNGPRWLFQFQIRNTASTTLTIRGTGQEHQFVVSGNTGAAPPNNVGVAQLSSPSASEVAANHPDLASTLQTGGTAQGWLAVDTTNLGFTPIQLLYRDKAVQTTGCTNPEDPSTCQPATLYTGVDWFLQ